MHFIYLPFEASLPTPDRFLVIYFNLQVPHYYRRFMSIILVHDAFMHSLIISFVRTVLRVLSSTHLACWFGQMLMKAISWMMSLIASPAPRGIPVSPVPSWIWSLVLYTLPPPTIRVLEPHSDARWAVRFRSHVTHFTVTYPPPLLLRVSSYATIPLVSYPPLCIISACL